MNIGFVGLGIMGKPMALNLIKGGHTIFLYSLEGIAPELTAAGGAGCASSREVAQKGDVVIMMVPDTPDVEAVLFAPEGWIVRTSCTVFRGEVRGLLGMLQFSVRQDGVMSPSTGLIPTANRLLR